MQEWENRFDEIEAEVDARLELRYKPAGTIQITSGDHVLSGRCLVARWPLCGSTRPEGGVGHGGRVSRRRRGSLCRRCTPGRPSTKT